MAAEKKSFLLYADFIEHFEDLTDEEAGKLIKHIFRYVNDRNPEAPDRITQVAFNPIKQSLKRDLVKWEGIKVKKSEAGKASAEAKRLAKESTHSTPVDSVDKNSTHSTVSVSVSVSDSVTFLKEEMTSAGTFETDAYIDGMEVIEPEFYTDERQFLKDFNEARRFYDKIDTDLEQMVSYEKTAFRQIKTQFPIPAIRDALCGMFMQDGMYKVNRLRPKHFLENVELYKECEKNGIKLFEQKQRN